MKFNKLTNIAEYPEDFKIPKGNAVVMTGFNHEEYFHFREAQEMLVETKYSGNNN